MLAAAVEAALAARARGEDRLVEFGRYRLLRSVGAGGMGQVFEAWDPQLHRHVAIKLVLRGGERATLEEARCLARLTHPNVVSVHEAGRVDDLVYIAMELVDGPDLRRWLRIEPRGWEEIVVVLLAAARGLAAVHDAGMLHGDVKPGNVLIGRDGRVRIADFGLARTDAHFDEGAVLSKPELDELLRALEAADPELLDEPLDSLHAASAADRLHAASAADRLHAASAADEIADDVGSELALDELRSLLDSPSLLRGGPAGGTIPYMAPERLAGGSGDPAADQYSFCATAWEALFGALPGTLPGPGAPRARDRVPPAVEAVLKRGLAEDPRARWPSMDALCLALERARERRASRRRGMAGALAVAVTVGSLFGLADISSVERECAQVGQGLRAQWGASQRLILEQRFASSDLPLPRSESQFVVERLDGWVEDWSAMWSRSCGTDLPVRGCLVHERARFEAVLALLEGESLGAARALVSELGSPTICLDAKRAPSLGVDGIGRLAELSAIERRIEIAVLAHSHDQAAAELRRFDEALARFETVAEPAEFALRRLAVEPLRARVLTATGEAGQARLRLRSALREAEAAGHDDLRFALLLEQTRLASRLTVEAIEAEDPTRVGWAEPPLPLDHPALRESPSFDDLAALDGLAERIDAGPVARAEMSLIRARLVLAVDSSVEDHRQLTGQLESAGEALTTHQPQGYADLRLELALRRAQLHFANNEFEAASRAAERARAIGESHEQFVPRLRAALTLAGVSYALLGECERVGSVVEALWLLSERSMDTRLQASRWASRWASRVDWASATRRCPDLGGDLQSFFE